MAMKLTGKILSTMVICTEPQMSRKPMYQHLTLHIKHLHMCFM